MPVMNGTEAAKTIREIVEKDPKRHESIIIAQTASSFEEDRELILEAGCDDFLSKPYKESDVFDMIHKHLGVLFVYAEEAGARDTAPQLEPGALSALPGELLDALKQGSQRADFILISNIIDRIRGHDAALADALARLAENFEYDKILELIQELK